MKRTENNENSQLLKLFNIHLCTSLWR